VVFSIMQALQAERGVVMEEALGDAEEIETLFQEAGQNDALLTTDQVLQQANLSLSRNLPPHDVTATTPEGAYPLDRLIMQEEWKALDVKEIKVAAKKSSAEEALRHSDTYPNFVLSRLQRIRVEVGTFFFVTFVVLLSIFGFVFLCAPF
jgi:DNA-directed RNA polymerase I subunit RPA49